MGQEGKEASKVGASKTVIHHCGQLELHPSAELWETVQNAPELSHLRDKESMVYVH